jgi:hypothetical protein
MGPESLVIGHWFLEIHAVSYEYITDVFPDCPG